jgi:VIT1/CCC1 family predicted Fe2+/Mn2+ transporter
MGLANIFADGFSMGTGRYLSIKTEQELGTSTNIKALKSGIATAFSFFLLGLILLLPFIFSYIFNYNNNTVLYVTVILLIILLFSIGIIKSKFTKKPPIQSGLNTLFIGGIGSIIAYTTGFLLKNIIK